MLVPGQVPDGFRLDAVTYNADVAEQTGAEGVNPAADHVVAMRWRRGFDTFTVTLRPEAGDPQGQSEGAEWVDPFGAEGSLPSSEPVAIDLPGRPTLDGELVMAAPFTPHLWGITGDIVVTVDGDLTAGELRAVAASLRVPS